MMWTGGFGWGGGWMILGSLMMLLFWGGLIVLLVWAVRGFGRGGTDQPTQISGSAQTPTALEILKTRYAKGEITQEEFEQIRRDLVSS